MRPFRVDLQAGHPVPLGVNVADFALNLVDCDPEDPSSSLAKITNLWPQVCSVRSLRAFY